ncbi:MAG: Formate acetyltransferase [Firmicutes bacterium ADurb.Bin099]|jgi:formate C-acetyltransferase|nr:MAG: Formate acetyltransferase [Firmicutes bacterium ADurb.Bin099]HPY98760.1 pyruvate formate lyase family protein [Clostridia bacterium]HQC68684.1 pyruvate formate lyase family protein [Clostridia bacterium]
MNVYEVYTQKAIDDKASLLFKEERSLKRLDGWFLAREIVCDTHEELKDLPKELRAAYEIKNIITNIPLGISENNIFAGTQRDAFARSYALINPSFRVETFSGYCDPTAIYDDIEPNEEFTRERIAKVKEFTKNTEFVKKLTKVYDDYEQYTKEVIFFVEQVTGHVIPDFRPALKYGVKAIIENTEQRIKNEENEQKRNNLAAMKIALECVVQLANRYADIAASQYKEACAERKKQLALLESTLRKVPALPSENLYEAIQAYLLLWQVMCLEQAPNPFAFSVGNADRIFEPYRKNLTREQAASLFRHFLVFYNVGDRSWAISQNVLLGGKSNSGVDLTNVCTYALLDAYYAMNFPQPILSVKLHKNTPQKLYEEMGRFFFTPGCLTPSFFNDDSVFQVLKKAGIEEADLEDYSVAGCQEPLIMGKDNGNTTNSWLNLGKILEMTINNGRSLISGEQLGRKRNVDNLNILGNIKEYFYDDAKYYIKHMADAANGASVALSELPVPFLSSFMGGLETGYDMRDVKNQGTRYNASGCLIHGLSVVADSIIAIEEYLKVYPDNPDRLINALRNNFEGDSDIKAFLKNAPKYGNNIPAPDALAKEISEKISDYVKSTRNYLGNGFRADWSTPTTHLLYGYWVGATPDGRAARQMLNYGIDPLHGDATMGLGFRILSCMNLPFAEMDGGYASHFGIDPKYFTAPSYEEKGIQFKERVIEPLFFNKSINTVCPYYLYVNVTTADTLRKVLAEPEKYAPSGVYIMRIHGTFVNFLDLSPAIQKDIITRLDPKSTSL